MADIPTTAWNETDASNTGATPPGFPPNSSPVAVYTVTRAIIGAVKREWDRNNPTVTSAGTNTITLSYPVNPTAYVTGMRFSFIAGATNTGPVTLNVGGLGPVTVFTSYGALVGGEITINQVTELFYDGTNFQFSRAATGTPPVQFVTSGGTNTVTLTYTVAPAAYTAGMEFAFIAGGTNTGAATLNVNGLGPKAIQSNGAALIGGELVAGQVAELYYDGTVFQFPRGAQVGTLLGRQVFTTTGANTYTSTIGTRIVFVEVQGAGGGGGGCALTGAAVCAAGGPGGAGGYVSKVLTTGFTGGVTVTVGAGGAGGTAGANNGTNGGDTTFGALLTGSHGIGGGGSTASAVPQMATAGVGGAGGGAGGLAMTGGDGATTINGSVTAVMSGPGGASKFGPGAPASPTLTGTAGQSAPNPGGGGSGGANTENQAGAHSGGAGHDGICIVWEYA